MQTIKTGMNNKQMKKIAMKQMAGSKKPTGGTETYHKTLRGADKARDLEEDKELSIKTKKKSAPMIKPSHRGLLHEKLGVPQGKKIPPAKISKALNSKSPKLRQEANFARNFGK